MFQPTSMFQPTTEPTMEECQNLLDEVVEMLDKVGKAHLEQTGNDDPRYCLDRAVESYFTTPVTRLPKLNGEGYEMWRSYLAAKERDEASGRHYDEEQDVMIDIVEYLVVMCDLGMQEV